MARWAQLTGDAPEQSTYLRQLRLPPDPRWVEDSRLYFDRFKVGIPFTRTGKQAVLVLSCDNAHMGDDVMVEPGLVMIFAHGVE